jgi:phenylalanyl-tRNA synthetase beta chain
LPFLNHKIVGDQGFEFKHKLRCYISLLGMKEIITFSIEAEEDLAGLNEEGLIKLVNPLRKQENTMRPSLFLGMIKALKHNLNRGSGQLKFFEIANTYCLDQNGYSESPVLSLAVTGKDNFTYLKAVIENVSRNLNLETLKFQEKPRKNFSNSLEIIINKQTIGFLGKLDLKLAKKMDLRADIFFSQIDINALQQFSREKLYREFSLYPAVSRDISLAIRKDKKFDAIKNIIKNEQGYIVDLQVIDTYKGKDLPSDFTALTLRVFYQSPQKTFTSEEVDGLHNRIREELQKQDGIVLR